MSIKKNTSLIYSITITFGKYSGKTSLFRNQSIKFAYIKGVAKRLYMVKPFMIISQAYTSGLFGLIRYHFSVGSSAVSS